MTTTQTDAYWEAQKQIVENFSQLNDITEIEEAYQELSQDNSLPIATVNQIDELYNEMMKTYQEDSREEFINNKLKHV